MAREKKEEKIEVNFNANVANLKSQLEKADKEFKGDFSMFAMALLTRSNYISGNRTIMVTSHLKQMMTLVNPEIPKVFTEFENMTGKYSTGIQRAKRNWKVLAKSYKFEEGNHLYTLFVKDTDSEYYDVIQKKVVEDLTEKYGFRYNNETIDNIQVGDIIRKGEVLYKSTSYDFQNNYRFGMNVTFCYTTDVRTTEDAIKVSESIAKKMTCVEVETIKVSINDNDVLLNLYGDENNYKCFPDIGEYVNNKIICATRRINNDQIFYDFKESNLRKLNFSEDVLYVEGGSGGKIVDIRVYSNKPQEEMDNNLYHTQVNQYYKNEMRYYQEIIDNTKEVITEIPKDRHSRNFNYIYKKAKDILDPNVKWCEQHGKKPFSNIMIEFTIEREVPLKEGSKITGLFGNKGVVSEIVPDDLMPILENGKRVDIIFNCLGVVNRLNSFQLYEQSINFIMNRTIDRMKTLETNDQRAALVFTMIKEFNTRQATEMGQMYSKLNVKERQEFIDDIYEQGVFVHIPPFWHDRVLFDVLTDVYKKYDWIKPYKAFIKMNGRYRPIMNDLVVGEMYIIRLKQTASKGFSSRSVGGVSLVGTPVKDAQAKENKILYSKTPCRLGLDEILNLLIGMDPKELAKQNMSYRNSIEGTHNLPVQLLQNGMVDQLREDEDIINRNVEILESYLKPMGYRMKEANTIKEIIFENISDEVREREINGEKLLLTDAEYIDMVAEMKVDEVLADEIFIGTVDEYHTRREVIKSNILEGMRTANIS